MRNPTPSFYCCCCPSGAARRRANSKTSYTNTGSTCGSFNGYQCRRGTPLTPPTATGSVYKYPPPITQTYPPITFAITAKLFGIRQTLVIYIRKSAGTPNNYEMVVVPIAGLPIGVSSIIAIIARSASTRTLYIKTVR